MRFLDDGNLPIDNGIVERLHRKPIVGIRNWLFCGSDAGGERAAIAFTVLATCRLNGVNPVAYLADVLPRLARGIMIARDLPGLIVRSHDPLTLQSPFIPASAPTAQTSAATMTSLPAGA